MQKDYEDNKKNGLVADPFTPRTFSETISQMLHNWRSAKSRGTRPKASSIRWGRLGQHGDSWHGLRRRDGQWRDPQIRRKRSFR